MEAKNLINPIDAKLISNQMTTSNECQNHKSS